jgi:hypothetical protein
MTGLTRPWEGLIRETTQGLLGTQQNGLQSWCKWFQLHNKLCEIGNQITAFKMCSLLGVDVHLNEAINIG